MSLSLGDVERLLNAGQMARGMAMSQRRRGERPGNQLTRSEREFLDEIIASGKRVQTQVPQHPSEAARTTRPRDGDDLTPVELAWLQRLPLDPTKVSFDAAVELSALAGSVSKMNAPASARLVESIWQPVKAVHDKRVAEARLAAAKEATALMPTSTHQVILDDLSQTYPDLNSDALALQAREVLSGWEAGQQKKISDRVAEAERDLGEVNARQVEMAETSRDVMAS